jgi:hypothetical protein
VVATGSGFSLSWPAIPARRYRVQYTDDLSQPFVNLSGELIAAQGQYSMTYNDTTAGAAVRRFYRVQLLNP